MTTLTIKVTTQYGSHPITGRSQIKARAKSRLGMTAVRTLAYDHGMSIAMNHQGAGYAAMNKLVQKISGFPAEPGNVTREQTLNESGRCGWTYTVEY